MMRFVFRRLLFQNLLKITVCALVSATVVVPLAWGQHGGGASHAGGGAHAGGGPLGGFHGTAPRPSALPAWHPRTPASPPLLRAGTGAFRFRQRPIHIVPPRPIFFGLPLVLGFIRSGGRAAARFGAGDLTVTVRRHSTATVLEVTRRRPPTEESAGTSRSSI
jgi:hypothetical protein